MCFVQSLDFNLPNSLSFTECGGNVSGQTNGVIHSPNYPEKYATSSEAASIQCHWFIHVNPGHKVMMYFETFEVEGNPTGIVIFYTLFHFEMKIALFLENVLNTFKKLKWAFFEFLYWPFLTWINLLQIEDVHRPLWEYGLGKKKTRHLWNYVGILWINIRRSLRKPILWESRKFSRLSTYFSPLMIQIKRQILALRNFEKFPVVVVLLWWKIIAGLT